METYIAMGAWLAIATALVAIGTRIDNEAVMGVGAVMTVMTCCFA